MVQSCITSLGQATSCYWLISSNFHLLNPWEKLELVLAANLDDYSWVNLALIRMDSFRSLGASLKHVLMAKLSGKVSFL